MKMRLTAVWEYDTGDEDITVRDYQTTDPDKCAALDSQNVEIAGGPHVFADLFGLDLVSYEIEPVKE